MKVWSWDRAPGAAVNLWKSFTVHAVPGWQLPYLLDRIS